MTDSLERHPGTGLWMRPGTLDGYVIGERRQYIHLLPRDGRFHRLLDIGANIGSIAWTFSPWCEQITCFEPDPGNFELLKLNTAGCVSVTAYDAAVVSEVQQDAPATATLWLNKGKNKGNHSLVESRGREPITVHAFSWSEAVRLSEPDLIKVDIEGGEYAFTELWESGLFPDKCQGLAVELHLTKKGWREEQAPRLVRAIEGLGFEAVKAPKIGEQNWTTLSVWRR